MYSYGPPHMDELKRDDQLEHTYSSYVRIRDIAQKTCQRRWTIGKSAERGSGISVLAAQHHDDDDDGFMVITSSLVSQWLTKFCGTIKECLISINLKKCEKRDKYLDLARELKKLWNMKVTIVPIVIGAFGTISKGLLKGIEDLEVGGREETIHYSSKITNLNQRGTQITDLSFMIGRCSLDSPYGELKKILANVSCSKFRYTSFHTYTNIYIYIYIYICVCVFVGGVGVYTYVTFVSLFLNIYRQLCPPS